MEEFSNQIEEIKTLITSNSKSDKSFGYSTLLHLQEQSTQHPSAIEALSKHVCHLILSIIADISVEDEEIASQALKCLGFMIYHPSLVAAFSEDVAHLVVASLVKLITTTKIKAVCNLGVWCISMQQLNESFLACNFHSLLRAIIHALDNPIGSLSTTFEAMQAVIKLAAQLSDKMRDTSNIWAPVIYRRLLSSDKREREMTERCLLKIKPTMLPPTLNLSKALVVDMKTKLLSEMKEVIQDRGRKVNTIQAWGWYIRLLGSHALKNRQLLNEMLKIPEQTFSDFDPQVQTASQVAWEGLIDALIHHPSEPPPEIMALECVAKQRSSMTLDNCNFENMGKALQHVAQQRSSMTLNRCNYENMEVSLSKSLRLIMTPLVGILSSKCDISVRSSCLNTWCYLLHKLDLAVNCQIVLKTVIEPILEVVFQMGTDDKNRWLWNICLDLLDDHILLNNRDGDNELSQHVSCRSSTRVSSLVLNSGAQCSFKNYPIKWLPWDLSKLGLPIKVIHILVSQGSLTHLTPECKNLACKSALKAFRSVLKGIQIEFKKSSSNYGEIMLCLNTILSLTKQVCEDATSKQSDDLLCTSLHFVGVVREELEPSVLASPLYKVVMDFKYVSELQTIVEIECPKVPEISSLKYMDLVSPTVYLTILHLCMGARSISDASRMEMILHGLEKHLRYLKLAMTSTVCDLQADLSVTARFFSALASFVCRLRLKCHILLLVEIISNPMIQLLSKCAPNNDMIEGSIVYQLQLLWGEILSSMERSQPPIIFDSSFLKVQAPVLETTLDSPILAIAESTITFWNHTYGNQVNLDYRRSLLPVLDKLSRKGKLNIYRSSPTLIVNDRSKEVMSAPLRYRVAATQNKISKRVELMEDRQNDFRSTNKLVPGLKRRKFELTEHQKEVRRAQQGRDRDCSGHGPGIRTYTSVDFSQGNEESQESQELRDPESILEMLRKAP
ncbi:Telomere-associated protein rif1 [Thalictrum thalictroides]|uniref:Telomere-associated protein rif1 n=1 Tax=Thalictrum thalictroides TaxID=46969 RepID=A0A7J6X3S9_THATH|nr:Telomere-associated protein rif1 [Thalictrum thalictroides]